MAVETDFLTQSGAALDSALSLIAPNNPFYINKIVGETLKSTFLENATLEQRTVNGKPCATAILNVEGDMGTAALKAFPKSAAKQALYLKQSGNENSDQDMHFCIVLPDPKNNCLVYFYQNQHDVDSDSESIIYQIEIIDSTGFTERDTCAFVTEAAIRFSNVLIYTSMDMINATISNFIDCKLNLEDLVDNILSQLSVEAYLSVRNVINKSLYRDAADNHLLAKRVLESSHQALSDLDDLVVSVKTDGKVINYEFDSEYFAGLVDVDASSPQVAVSTKIDKAPEGFDEAVFALSVKNIFTLDTLNRYASTGEGVFNYYSPNLSGQNRVTP